MKLERLYLRNFRCFEELVVDFDSNLTVVVAENGAGKTAILDAIAIGFGRYLTKLPGVSGRSTKETDIRVNERERKEPFMMLGWEAKTQSGEPLLWSGGRKRDSTVSSAVIRGALSDQFTPLLKSGFKQIDGFATNLILADLDGAPYFLPVIAYYGTNRAIRDEVRRRRGFRNQFSRFEALTDALEPDSRFRAAFEWFNAMEDQERREKELQRDFDYRLPELELVRNAIERVLPVGFSNPRTETRPLRFVIDRQMSDGITRTLRIAQLSDGYRVVLGLVMDLARRMAQANGRFMQADGSFVSPLDFPAVAIIDEIDLHLHPAWQQKIVDDLMHTFPGTQFIVTTHSPQVLSTVPCASIRILSQQWDIESERYKLAVLIPEQQTQGVASADILADVMGTDPTPDVESANQLSQYKALIQQGIENEDPARTLRLALENHFGIAHPALLECDRLIRLQNFKRQLPQRG